MTPLYHSNQPLPKTSGIYRITCTTTGKFYIGSAVNLKRRWQEHRKTLRGNYHPNPYLQASWNKYGEQTFTFEVIELVLPPFLIEREQYWLDKLQAIKKGFNLAPTAGSSFGREVSQSTRKKIGDANRGKPGPNLGKKLAPETREKLSIIASQRTSNPFLGKSHTAEARAKMSEARRKRITKPETRVKLSEASKRYKRTEKQYAAHMKTIIAIAPDGTEYVVTGINRFCKAHNLYHSALVDVANGKHSQHKGWKARWPDVN